MDEHDPDSKVLGYLVCAQHRVLEEGTTEAASLVGEVDGQPSQQDGWKWALSRLTL